MRIRGIPREKPVQWVTLLGAREGTDTSGYAWAVLDIVGPFATRDAAAAYGKRTQENASDEDESSFEVFALQVGR